MSYQIYHQIKVTEIKQKEVRPMSSPTDEHIPENYWVTMASFSNHTDATYPDFEGKLAVGDSVSVAVSEEHRQVIAFVNHSQKTEGYMKLAKMGFGDIFGTLLFITFPSALLSSIAYKAFQNPKYTYIGYGAIVLAVLIVFLILRGLVKLTTVSKKALSELKKRA